MTRRLHLIFLPLASALLLSNGEAAESLPFSGPGIERIQILTDVQEILPGETFTVGLLVSPAPGHHTYWRGPGIVGVATSIEWNLPDGFTAGPIIWPSPEKVDMVGIEANGYRRDVILLTDIKAPEAISSNTLQFELKTAWMACATSCNPGVTTLSLTLPVIEEEELQKKNRALSKQFQSIRASLPRPAPVTWTMQVSRSAEEEITLAVSAPGLERPTIESLEFFCDDMQVNSDKPMQVQWLSDEPGSFAIRFVRPTFAPSQPEVFSGLLKAKRSWPGLDSNWVEISIPWKEEASHE